MTPRGKRKLEEPEVFKVIVACGRFDITIEEKLNRPGYVVMRRWRPAKPRGQWQTRGLGEMMLRDGRGAILDSAVAVARDAAMKWYMELTGEIAAAPVEDVVLPFTIGETWKAITDPETGKYPHASQFRTELRTALEFAGTVWGEATPWSAIEVDDWTKLIRRRLNELVARKKTGIRATEITVSRIGTAVIWLRERKKIPANAAYPDPKWREALLAYWKGKTGNKADPEPSRPRYTVEDSRKLILGARDVDPRTGLLMALGAELRLGQVVRAKRSHLDMTIKPWGQLTVEGSGDKHGEVIALTRGQAAAVDYAFRGYLREFERRGQAGEIDDYYLFAGGFLTGRAGGSPFVSGKDPASATPLTRAAIWRHWQAIEALVGVPHVAGRGPYGIRRTGVDAALAENISEQGLKNFGGWTTPDMPRRVYAEKQNTAGRAEATTVRAAFRGESE